MLGKSSPPTWQLLCTEITTHLQPQVAQRQQGQPVTSAPALCKSLDGNAVLRVCRAIAVVGQQVTLCCVMQLTGAL
jgi:hypothetical protein